MSETKNPYPRGDISYSQFKTLLLPAARYFDSQENEVLECVESYGPFDDWSGHHPTETTAAGWPKPWKTCTQDALTVKLGAQGLGPPRYEGPNGAFLLQDADWGKPDVFRINLGYLRRAAATNIVSRYIDIIAKPCDELRFLTFQSPQTFTITGLVNAVDEGNPGWSGGCDGAETLLATRAQGGSSAGWFALSGRNATLIWPHRRRKMHL